MPDSARQVREIEVALQLLAPSNVRVGARQIDAADVVDLHPHERSFVERAVPTRRHEFATGRAVLRGLLGTDVAIGIDERGAPMLPTGVRGSLSHDDRWAVGALTFDGRIRALGIDIEPAAELPPGMAALILRPDERGVDAHLAFTLKEAAYKAWSSAGGRLLEHHELRLDVDTSTFTATVVGEATTFTGQHTTVQGRFLALVVA